MLSKEERDAIRELCEAATPGPWFHDGMHDEVHAGNYDWVLDEGELPDHPDAKPIDAFGHRVNPNYVFAAHARQAVPKLLEALEIAEDLNEAFAGGMKEIVADRDRWKAERDHWKLLAEQNLKTAELVLAESDRWKTRAKALERTLKMGGSCGTCIHSEKLEAESPCIYCLDCDDAADFWQLDEARFLGKEDADE